MKYKKLKTYAVSRAVSLRAWLEDDDLAVGPAREEKK
jgi:hypothetical protein